MRSSPVLLVLVALKGALADCNANNCLREIRGTAKVLAPDLPSRTNDCSSFMQVTVTPATSTSTISATATIVLGAPQKRAEQQMAPRQVTVSPSSKPAYATACSDVSAYSSACSCMGITLSTTTAPAPTTSVTVTVATVTVCPPGSTLCGGSCKNLQTDTSNCGSCGGTCNTGQTCSSGGCVGQGACVYNPNSQDEAGQGGCSSSCYCDKDVGGFGVCDQFGLFPSSCARDADCGPPGSRCIVLPDGENLCGTDCNGPAKKMLARSLAGRSGMNFVRGKACRIQGRC